MAIVIRNTNLHDSIDSLAIPTREDGGRYRYEMICDNGWTRLYDDSIVGFLAHMILGYESMDEAQRLKARIRHAIDTQVHLQAQLNLFFNQSPVSQDEYEVITAPKHIQPKIESWGCSVPLVLIDAFYFPYSPTPRPYSEIEDVAMPSNIWWLKPADGEMEYLLSLHEISFLDLNISKDEVN